jgi:hypothetical protein
MQLQHKHNNALKAAFSQADLWVGSLLFLGGLWACFEASGFDLRSRTYPIVLAVLLSVAGLAIACSAILSRQAPPTMLAPFSMVLGAAFIFGFWAFALRMGAGFALPTFAMQVALLRMSGIQRWSHVLFYALVITAIAYVLFALLLGIRFPSSFLSHISRGL